ncbi:hypothetical protein AB0M46_05775 [Dactylosporangium sp. NPDC051485]|uniref:hypothetical protein n=1 Tax=Dactylosporangium sp. NPDC051485 TaxID=3154846 RepID=UPI00342F2683
MRRPSRGVLPQLLLGALFVVLFSGLAGVVGTASAVAAPTPAPSPTPGPPGATPTPTASPTAPGTPPPSSDNPFCGGTVPSTQKRWCFLWVRYTASPPAGAPSHWITGCARSLTTDQMLECQTVALTLDDRPGDGTPTVLGDVAPGTPTAPELVRCDLFADRAAADPGNANRWNYKRDRCKIAARTLSFQLREPDVPNPTPPPTAPPTTPPGHHEASCGLTDVSCQVKDIVNGVITSGFQGLVNAVVQTMAVLLGYLAKAVFTVTAPTKPDGAFFLTYNSAAGIILLFLVLFFIVSVIRSGLRVNGPSPVATLGGLVRAILGIFFCGGIAWVILAAWDDATNSLITANQNQKWDASAWVTALSNLTAGAGTGLIALGIAGFSCIGLLLVLITQIFRGEIAQGAALVGVIAATGQVSSETQHWLRRWFWTLNALGMSRFFIVELWIYGTRTTYESDDLRTALRGLLLIWMMVMTPWVLLRLLTIVDGYLSDINGRAVLAAAGAQAAAAAGDGPGGSGNGGSTGNPAQHAAQMMNANLADLPSTAKSSADTGREQAKSGVDQAQQQLGLSDGPGKRTADAVGTAGDGSTPGSGTAGPSDGGSTGADGGSGGAGDHPNADEAAGVQQHTQQAKSDVNAASSTTGGNAAPGAGATSSNTTGGNASSTVATTGAGDAGSGGAGSGGADAGHGSGAGTSADADPMLAAANADQHHQQAEPPHPQDLNSGGEHGAGSSSDPPGQSGQPPSGDAEPPPGGGGSGGPPGSGGGGGASGGAAAGAADIPIVPV